MSTIIIGVDASERSEDAIAFGRRLGGVAAAHVIVANAYAYSEFPTRTSDAAYRNGLREDALILTRAMRERLEGIPEDRSAIRIAADPSPAKALHHLAHAERAALVIVGSTHTGSAGRVLPGATGERLLHGAPCSVAVVPEGYRTRIEPIARVAVGYDATPEATAAVAAAAMLAKAFGARLELIGVIAPERYSPPELVGSAALAGVREEVERRVQKDLDALVAELPEGVEAITTCRTGGPAEVLAERSREADVLVVGSRGYGPLRSVLIGGVSGRVLRSAECPVIIVPRGIEAPLETLFTADAVAP